ncbi:MAG: hypothetical protein AAF891_11470, partial [Pseudomonadota bacterium]
HETHYDSLEQSIDILLKEPEPEIDADFETEMTQRAVDLEATPEDASLEDKKDPVLDRLDALRAKRDAQEANGPLISDDLRKRLKTGVTEPQLPE